MPHDIMPIESDADVSDSDPAEFPSPDQSRPSILSAMKEAGRALVRKAKRTIRNPALAAAMVAAGAGLVAPHAAQAQCALADGIVYASLPYCGAVAGGAPLGGPTLGPSSDNPGSSPVGDPVDVATGNVFLHITDYTTAGPNPLQMIRYYNSLSQAAVATSLASTLGTYTAVAPIPLAIPLGGDEYEAATPPPGAVNWRTNYDGFLQFSTTDDALSQVIAEQPNGQQITFTLSGSTWTPPSNQDYTLTQSGSTWVLTDHNDTQQSYTDTGYGWAQLNTITARNGYQQTLNYSGEYAGTNTVQIVYFPAGTPTIETLYPNRLQSVTDSYGRSLTFGYNDNGLLTSVSTPDSLVVSYGYTYESNVSTGGSLGPYTGDPGYMLTSVSYNTSPTTSQTYNYALTSSWPYELTSIVDENGNTATSWTYNNSQYGRATFSYQGGSGIEANYTNLSYSTGSTSVYNAYGVADTYNYSVVNGVGQITEIDRAATSGAGATAAASRYLSYDGNGYLASATDWNGNQTNYTNNSYGNPTSITEAYGSAVARTTTITYDDTWVHLPASIATTGVTRTFTYDGSGNPLTMTDTDTTSNSTPYSTNGQTRETQWTWNGTGEPLTVQLPRTDTTVKYTYTWSSGCLTSITDQLSHETGITSSTGGCYPTIIVDPNSVTTALGWDTRLNLNTVTVDPSGGDYVTTYTHDPANNLASVQKPDGSTLTYTRNAANQLTAITDIPGNTVNFNPDSMGNSIETWFEDTGSTTRYVLYPKFDNLERTRGYNSYGNTWTYAHDPNGNLTSATDPLSNVWTYTYDALNRLSTRTDPNSGVTTYTYDAHNRLTNVQDANSNSTAYVRDGFGEVTQMTSPDTGTTVYHYDKDGNLTQKVFNGGQTVNLTYDAIDRNLTISYPADSTLNISKTWDQSGHGYGVGRLTSVTDQPGSDSFTYDKRGNVTAESRVITDIGTLSTSTSFDASSNISSITYPSGTVVSYSRDSMGNVTGISATPPGGTATTVASSIAYEPFGPEKSLTYGNGIAGTYAYDSAYRPTSRTDTASGCGDYLCLYYSYYGNNSLNTITDYVNSANSQTLDIDALDRMTSAVSAAGGYGTYAWTWDANSNLATQTINSTITTASLNSGSNQLASLAVTGGATTTVDTTSNGNILDFKISGTAITSYTYNAANQIASATGPLGASGTYEYGFDGQRLLKTPSSGNPITYQYGQAAKELLAENDLHAGQAADYVYMDPGKNTRPIGQVDPTSGNVYYTHTDRQGTPQAVTDSGASVVWSAFYNPFGDTSSFSGTLTTQSLRLPGQQFDPETGNNHNGFRDYAGTLTRYVQSDPIGLRGGMNTYQYAKANPLKYTDRFGLDPGITCTIVGNCPAGTPAPNLNLQIGNCDPTAPNCVNGGQPNPGCPQSGPSPTSPPGDNGPEPPDPNALNDDMENITNGGERFAAGIPLDENPVGWGFQVVGAVQTLYGIGQGLFDIYSTGEYINYLRQNRPTPQAPQNPNTPSGPGCGTN